MDRSLILTGFMGAGKSSVARLVGRRLGLDSLDLDDLVESRAGMSISEIFGSAGEEGFRRLEADALRSVVSGVPVVVATGGGVLLREENRRILESAVVVNLCAPFEVLFRRISGSEHRRPLLRGGEEGVRELFDSRSPLYEAVRFKVDTVGKSLGQVAEEVARIYLREVGECR